MWLLPLLILADPNSVESPHLERNPVYQELRETGVTITNGGTFKPPEPYLADGLDAATQRKLIEKLGGRRYPWERITRDSAVAPQIIHLSEEKSADPNTKVRIAHVYYIAYGDLDALAKEGELNEPENTNDKQWKTLSPEDLAAKQIQVKDADHEAYGYISNDLIERVRITGVLRTYWSQTEESVVAAAMLDPRFDKDAHFPNRWQPLTRGREGFEAGKPSPYHGAGGYTKITKLKAPEDALFVESHLIFAEPHAWFDGANLLGSKLPAVIQHEVRGSRRELKKAGQ